MVKTHHCAVFCSEELSCLPYKNPNKSLTLSSWEGKFKFAVLWGLCIKPFFHWATFNLTNKITIAFFSSMRQWQRKCGCGGSRVGIALATPTFLGCGVSFSLFIKKFSIKKKRRVTKKKDLWCSCLWIHRMQWIPFLCAPKILTLLHAGFLVFHNM